MTPNVFLNFVEIRTKLASVVPFLLGTAYAFYRFKSFHWTNALIMFIAILFFDMTTTAINNYMDFSTAIKKDGFGYAEHNAIVKYKIKPRTALNTILIMLFIATIMGILLFFRTNIVVLLLGIFSFGIGILYTFGPMPISRTPYGELFSGFVMGFIIPFIAVYIQVDNRQLIMVAHEAGRWMFTFDVPELFTLFLFTVAPMVTIANIMLANNICDIQEDIINGRKTLPIWVGEKKALYIFGILYLLGYVATGVVVIMGVAPMMYGIGILSGVVVFQNVKIFFERHVKGETFKLSVKNFMLVNVFNLVLFVIGIMI